MKTVKDVMTASPLSCGKNETLQFAAHQMAKSQIGFLPIVDDSKKVIGALTDRDICLAIGKDSKTPRDLKVQDVMNKTVYAISEEQSAAKALNLMRTKQVGRLPVVDQGQHLLGVVTLLGIIKHIKDSPDKSELETEGSDNILTTLYSLAERNGRKQPERVAAL